MKRYRFEDFFGSVAFCFHAWSTIENEVFNSAFLFKNYIDHNIQEVIV